ncbi:MAG: hypothetical protein U1C55_07645 [Smithellaceae bacterium]|nr:hypothetical protein [Smithellaceae bacterium]
MKLTILIIIGALGVAIPLLWITGTLTAIICFMRERGRVIRRKGAFSLNPPLGLTMADGGDAIDEEEKDKRPYTRGKYPL